MPLFAITFFAVLAMIGAMIALSMDNSSATNLQHTADSSALGGAIAFLQSDSPRVQDRTNEAKAQATLMAEQNANYELTSLDLGVVTEDAYGQHLNIEVELQFKPVNAAAGLTGRNANIDIKRRAVASATWGFPLCILSLSESKPGFNIKDSVALNAGDCLIWSNSGSLSSAHLEAGTMTAKYLCAHGNIRRGRGAIFRGKATESCDQLPDPMAEWEPPAAGSCFGDTSFEPPRNVANNGRDAPEFDSGNTDLYGPPAREILTFLDVKGSPTKQVFWGQKLEKRYTEIDRSSRSDNCHQHDDSEHFHCHRKDKQTGWVDHRDYQSTRYIPEDREERYGTIKEARASGETGIVDFDDLALIDNLEDWEYERDTNHGSVTNTLSPGTYCGIDISWGHVKMEPGLYFIKGAPLTVTRRAKLTADGVTLIFTEPGAYLRVSDEAEFNISAPVDGPTAGIAIAEDRNTRDSRNGNMVSRLSGEGAASITGLIYLPTQDFFLSGAGTGEQASPLLQMVVNRVALRDESKLNIDFEPGNTSVPVVIQPEREARLIE